MSGNIIEKEVEYRDIPGFPGYRVGTDGSVWSCRVSKNWRQLKPGAGAGDRLHVILCPNKSPQRVHRLVLLAFVGPCPDGMECCHNDGNHLNNKLGNLRWDTRKANHDDKIKHGTTNRGERNGHVKLTEAEVIAIRDEHRNGGATQQQLAEKFGVHQVNISAIVTRKIWRHI